MEGDSQAPNLEKGNGHKMIELKNEQQLAKAIERAKEIKPRVKFITFGLYHVQGSTGSFYSVTCFKRNGIRIADCDCVAGMRNKPCFHAAAAAGLHSGIASMR
jgi:hypothetical protein